MAHYFKNLLTAICGNNPYQMELDKVKEELEKAGENVRMLRESYHNELERAAQAESMMHEAEALLEKQNALLTDFKKQLTSCQALVETYREHNEELKGYCDQTARHAAKMEKDYHEVWANLSKCQAENEDLRKDRDRQAESYEKRIKGYVLTIDKLTNKAKEEKPKEEKE